MIKMFEKHKMPSLEAGLLIILVVISVFGIGYYSEGKVTGMVTKEVSGMAVKEASGMERVTGMAVFKPKDGQYWVYKKGVYTLQGSVVKKYNPNTKKFENADDASLDRGVFTSGSQVTEGNINVLSSIEKSALPTDLQSNIHVNTIREAMSTPPSSTGSTSSGSTPSATNNQKTQTFTITSSTGKTYEIVASKKSVAEERAVKDYGIKIASTTSSTATTTTGKNKYYAYFDDGSYEEIYTRNGISDAQTKADNIATSLDKTLASSDAVKEPEYRIYMEGGISTLVTAQSAKEALNTYKAEYPNVRISPTKIEEVKPGSQQPVEESALIKYIVTFTDGTTSTIEATGYTEVFDWARSIEGKEFMIVEQQKYTVTYNGKTEILASSELSKFTSDLKELGLSYRVKEASKEELCIDCQTYLIPLKDGTTVEKKFSNQKEADKYITTTANSLVDTTKSAKRVYTEKELKEMNLEVTDYFSKDGQKVYLNTKTNTLQVAPSDDTNNFIVYSGTISKIETIGNEEDPNSVQIRNWFEVMDGKKTSNVASTSIVDKTDPDNMDYDIPIDKETLSLIRTTITKKGTISAEITDSGRSATISIKDEDGRETTKIVFSGSDPFGLPTGMLGYNIEGDKLTGIKSQTDFKYTLDANNDGKITQEERDAEKYAQLTKRFSATEETDGKLDKIWYADDFRFGSDGYYFADMYMQQYTEKDGRRVPDGKPVYYYIEGGKRGDENAGEVNIRMDDKGELITDDTDRRVIKVEDGKAIDTQTGEDLTNKPQGKRALKRASQSASRRWFANLEFKLTQFKGLSGWSQLIIDKETLANWRENVDKFFSTFYLGTDYWVSGICAKHIPKQQAGTFMMKTKDSLFDVVAHVEGERTTIHGPEETQYLYKLTFSVRNPKYSQYDKLKFNVYLYGEATVQLYPQSIEVSDGKSFTRGAGKREKGEVKYDEQHGKPIVQYSDFLYNKICIKFDHGIINAEGDREDEVCNAIVEYKGAATEYEKEVIGVTAEGAPLTAAEPTDPYQEADF